jgi:YD repeat-containing protein
MSNMATAGAHWHLNFMQIFATKCEKKSDAAGNDTATTRDGQSQRTAILSHQSSSRQAGFLPDSATRDSPFSELVPNSKRPQFIERYLHFLPVL